MVTSTHIRVLVVDDDPHALYLAARMLEAGGIPSATVGSAEQAMVVLRASSAIDAILSDIFMPGTGGLEFLAQVRTEFLDRPWLQLLLITGQASVETAVAAMKLDASDYLLKPVETKVLQEAVTHALGRASSIRAITSGAHGASKVAELGLLASTARDLATHIKQLSLGSHAPQQMLEALTLVRRLQEARSSVFGPAVMPEPAWEMLAELMRARLAGQQVSITSLALASNSPTTTALRRIEDLIHSGLIDRVPDSSDRRRTHLVLTPTGVTRMQCFLEGFSRMVTEAH